jgi:hypothetical protein
MGAGRARRVKAGAVVIGKTGIPVNLAGSAENLPVEVAEGVDDEATLANLIAALESAGVITFTELV